MFWKARHLGETQVLHHLPFLFWLIEAQRPNLHVSLGVQNGVGYFGICQALDRLVPEAQSIGIDHWDEKGLKEWHAVSKVNQDYYSDSSHLFNTDPTNFEIDSPYKEADFLYIDCEVTNALADRILDYWIPRMSRKGLIAFHGIKKKSFKDSAGSALLKQLNKSKPTISFDNGDGIEVVLYGEDISENIRNLGLLSAQDPNYILISTIFSRLGEAHRYEWIAKNSIETSKSKDIEIQKNAEKLGELTEKLQFVENSYIERSRKAAEFQSQNFDLRQEIVDKKKQFEHKLKTKISELEQDKSELALNLAAAKKNSSKYEEIIESLKKDNREMAQNLQKFKEKSLKDKEFLEHVETEIGDLAAGANERYVELIENKKKLEATELRLQTRETALAQLKEQIKELQSSLDQKGSTQNKIEDANAVENKLKAQLKEQHSFLKSELEPKISSFLTQADLLCESYHKKDSSLRELGTVNATLKQDLDARVSQEVEITRRLELRGSRLMALNDEIKSLKDNYSALSDKYECLKNSTSWKVTSPARFAANLLRNTKE